MAVICVCHCLVSPSNLVHRMWQDRNCTCPTHVSQLFNYHEFEEDAIMHQQPCQCSRPVQHVVLSQPPPSLLHCHPLPSPHRRSPVNGCSNGLWMWTYSPVFLWLEPSLLNKLTLYALNDYQNWASPMVTLCHCHAKMCPTGSSMK